MTISKRNLAELNKEVEFTKCVIQESDTDIIVEEGEWFEIECSLKFDKSVLKTSAHHDPDDLIGMKLGNEGFTRVRQRLGYFNTQINKILHMAIRQMRLNESAHISFELDPDLLNESLSFKQSSSKLHRLNDEEKIYFDIKFEINLINIEKLNESNETIETNKNLIDQSSIYKLNEFQLYEISNEHKKEANDLFKSNFILTAFQRYHKAISYIIIAEQIIKEKSNKKTIENLNTINEDSTYQVEAENDEKFTKTLLQTKSQLYSNLAACQIKNKNFDLAIINCSKCLDLDDKNVKALFRRGQAYTAINEFDEAIRDFHLAISIDQNNNEIKQKLDIVEQLKKNYNQTMSSNLKKLFA